MESNTEIPRNHVQDFDVQVDTPDAIYTLDDCLEPCGVRPVTSVKEPLPFAPDVSYRVYFQQRDTPDETDSADLPHADIFMQIDGERCVEYDFRPTATPAEVESLELVVKTHRFQRSALHRWGGFKLIWGGPFTNDEYADGANLLLYYDDDLAFVSLRYVGVTSAMTFAQLLDDYLFLRSVVNRMLRLKRELG